MKKLIALLLALVMVVGLVACGAKEEAAAPAATEAAPAATEAAKEEAPAEESQLIGVAMPTKDLQRWVQDGDNMKAKLEEAGYTVDLQYPASHQHPSCRR